MTTPRKIPNLVGSRHLRLVKPGAENEADWRLAQPTTPDDEWAFDWYEAHLYRIGCLLEDVRRVFEEQDSSGHGKAIDRIETLEHRGDDLVNCATVSLNTLDHDRFELRRSISIEVEENEDVTGVYWNEVALFGEGPNLTEAIRYLRRRIVDESADAYDGDASDASEDLLEHWATLKRMVRDGSA